ncbi:MAG: pyridoxal phosphate-dependent aminotransferase [Planctomycetota bacterium]
MTGFLPTSRSGKPADDLIFALNAEASRRRNAGESVVNATLGTLMTDDGHLVVLDTAAKVVASINREHWASYAPIAGVEEFRRAAIADTFVGHPDWASIAAAVATPGGTGALRHAVVNFLEPGQAMLTTSFYWAPYRTICEEHGRRVETFPMFAADGGLDVAQLAQAVDRQLAQQGRVLLILNDPCHNPTGFAMSRSEWAAVADVLATRAERGPITLLVDMAYYLYGSSADPRQHLAELAVLLGRVNVAFAWSASKSFTHYGLRVGALIVCDPNAASRSDMLNALVFSCRGSWSNCNHGGQRAIARLLDDPALAAAVDAERQRARQLLLRRVAVFNEAARAADLRFPRYEGGFFVTVFDDAAEERARRMREEHGVFVVPQKGALRLALCAIPQTDVVKTVASIVASAS